MRKSAYIKVMVALMYIMLSIKVYTYYPEFFKVRGQMVKLQRAKRSAPAEADKLKTRMITFKVSEQEYQEYRSLAESRGMTLSELIRTGLRLLRIY